MSMDESAIVTPEVSTTTPDSEIKGGIESTYKEFIPLYDHFNIEKSGKTDIALSEIWEYCKSNSVNKDRDSIMLEVIRFDHELGTGSLSDRPYAKMLNYIKVYKQFRKAGNLLDELKKQLIYITDYGKI